MRISRSVGVVTSKVAWNLTRRTVRRTIGGMRRLPLPVAFALLTGLAVAGAHAGLLILLLRGGSIQKGIVRRSRNLQWLTGLGSSKGVARHVPIPSSEKLPDG